MPVFCIHHHREPPELLEADSARREGIHTTLRGTVLVMGRPREVVLRRVPATVALEEVEQGPDDGQPASAVADPALHAT